MKKHGRAWRTVAALIGLALLAAAASVAAQDQVYKWKDAKGEVHYGDTPPPQGAQVLPASARPPVDPSLPYELARAVRLYPVTLYTTARCAPCDQGRKLLRERGIPYTEKTVDTQDDQQAQHSLTGQDALPLLVVGGRQAAGFLAGQWQEVLDSASYPKRSMLPSGYRYAAPQPAAPLAAAENPPGAPVRATIKVPPDEAAARAEQAKPRQKAQPAPNTPPNFQF